MPIPLPEKTRAKSVTATPSEWATVEILGRGNASLGVRLAIAIAQLHPEDWPGAPSKEQSSMEKQ